MTTLIGPAGVGDLESATGWQLKPEGLCREDVCMLVPEDARGDAVSVWRHLGWPAVSTTDGDVTYLGEAASTRAAELVGGIAPDFRLRDLAGDEHALSDQRGRKVLLASWAPW